MACPSTLVGPFSVGANSSSPEIAHLGLPDVRCVAFNGRRAGGQSSSDARKAEQNSEDNTFGTFLMDTSDLPTKAVSFELDRRNTSNRFKLDLEFANGRSDTIRLSVLHFDYRWDVAASHETLQVIYTSGDLNGIPPNTVLATLSHYEEGSDDDIDIPLNSLADHTFGSGEIARLQLTVGYEGTTQPNDSVFIDNPAIANTYPLGTGPTPPGENAFQIWMSGFDTGGLSADGDDPDLDGLVNLVEFGLGRNPVASDFDVNRPALASEGVNWIYSFQIGPTLCATRFNRVPIWSIGRKRSSRLAP